MNNTIFLTLTSIIPGNVTYADQIIYKGSSQVEFDLSGISEDTADALNIIINWGDGSAAEFYSRNIASTNTAEEVEQGVLSGSILDTYEHVYTPTQTHVNEISAQIYINFVDGTYTTIVQPLLLVQESYHDNIKEFLIDDVSVHDNSIFSIVNLQSKYTKQTWPALRLDDSDGSDDSEEFPYAVGSGDSIFDPLGLNNP